MIAQLLVAAGGKGIRLQTDIPKSLFPIKGIPIIDRILQTGLDSGIRQLTIGVDAGKEELEQHILTRGDTRILRGCAEPLTSTLAFVLDTTRCDVVFCVNGDTIFLPRTLRKLFEHMSTHANDAGCLLTTSLTKKRRESSWTYWQYVFGDQELLDMREKPGHEVDSDFIACAFRVPDRCDLKMVRDVLSTHPEQVPFPYFSLGWDYVLRLFLYHGLRIGAVQTQDPSVNINTRQDALEAELLLDNEESFRQLRETKIY